jgi:hypothetical protein
LEHQENVCAPPRLSALQRSAPTMWLCLNTARRHRHSIESDEFTFDSHPIRGRIDRLAEIQSKSDRLLASRRNSQQIHFHAPSGTNRAIAVELN